MKKIVASALVLSLFLTQCSKKGEDNTPTPTSNLNMKSVGASARDFLIAASYNSLTVQVQYMPGFAPDVTALNNLEAYLELLVNKPGGVNILTPVQIAASGKSVFTLADITAAETNNRTLFTRDNVLGVYVLYLDGAYTTANVLGVAYRNTSLALFCPTVISNSGGINQTSRTKLETTVQEHEFGHLMGLVNLGSPMVTPHQDANNANHCNNASCLMFATTNTSVMGGILLSSPVPSLDANCRADLAANGGR